VRNGTVISQNTARTYVDVPPPGASYTYQIRAVDSRGTVGPPSAAITVEVPSSSQVGTDTSPPSTPTGVTAVSMVARQVYLSWLPSLDDQAADLTYKIWRGTKAIGTVSTLYFIDTPNKPGTYTYTVRAFDSAGNKSAKSVTVRGYAYD
jgi:cellulose 1,4-beta-cellobiosidase